MAEVTADGQDSLNLTLGYVSPVPAWQSTDPGPESAEVLMEARAAEALMVTAELWPGPVKVLVPEIRPLPPAGPQPAGCIALDLASGSIDVVVSGNSPSQVDSHGLDVVTGLLAPHMLSLPESRTPAVLTAEVDWRIRWGIQRALGARGINAARIAAGLARQERKLKVAARHAAGLQCNGPAAMRAYGSFVSSSVMYYDHRVRASDVALTRQVAAWDGNRTLRLGFSGRLDPIKGPQFALEATRLARARGLDVELTVFGTGPLENDLRELQGPGIHFAGFRNFRDQWLPEVRDNIDVMLLPHVQGDPSCTYFESLGCGSPILGFENSTLSPLVRDQRVGWAVAETDVDALAHQIEAIVEQPQLLVDARSRALEFMATNALEKTLQNRVDHTIQCWAQAAS